MELQGGEGNQNDAPPRAKIESQPGWQLVDIGVVEKLDSGKKGGGFGERGFGRGKGNPCASIDERLNKKWQFSKTKMGS